MTKLLALSMASVALTGSLYASEYTDLEAKLNALIEEVESLKASKTDKALSSYFGMGDAASRIYTTDEKVSVGGYGHTDYINRQGNFANGKNRDDITDNYRAIMYFGYNFSDNVKFQSEIEFEHANEVKVEFAAVDFLVNDQLNFRAGNFIIPVGNVNLRHEPTLFLNVSRPETERQIIPSTWHENGAMVYGKVGNFEYQFATTASLDGTNKDSDNNSSSVRTMRQSASKSQADDFAYSARLTYKPTKELQLIASGFTGDIDQGVEAINGAKITITEAHVLYNSNRFNFTALYAQTKTDGADKISANNNGRVASKTNGMYATLGVKFGKWIPFVHYEKYDEFAEGYNQGTKDTNTVDETTAIGFGFNYYPHKQVVLKADYMDQDVKTATTKTKDDRFSLGVGYLF